MTILVAKKEGYCANKRGRLLRFPFSRAMQTVVFRARTTFHFSDFFRRAEEKRWNETFENNKIVCFWYLASGLAHRKKHHSACRARNAPRGIEIWRSRCLFLHPSSSQGLNTDKYVIPSFYSATTTPEPLSRRFIFSCLFLITGLIAPTACFPAI